jgi:hypothetical protein
MKNTVLLTLLLFTLPGCAFPVTSSARPTPASLPQVTIISPGSPKPEPTLQRCQEIFQSRELKLPYTGTAPRYVLSKTELDAYLSLMGIQSLCIPSELGAPFLNVDWDSAKIPAKGRMISLGFENTYSGAGWSEIYLLYSTYDFSTGSEFERFARLSDWDTLRSHAKTGEVELNGTPAFTHYFKSMWGYENQPQVVYKIYVIPFESAYLAVVLDTGAYDDADAAIGKFDNGEIPTELAVKMKIMDSLAYSLHFKSNP